MVEEVVERRSMVGAPPTSARRPQATPSRSSRVSTARSSTRTGKRKREESDEETEEPKNEGGSEDDDQDDSSSDDESSLAEEKPKSKRRRTKKHLTDSVARKKRREAVRQAEKEAKLASGYISPEETKPPTPEPSPSPEPIVKTPSVTKYSPFQLLSDHLLRKIQSKDPEEYFAFPVTPSMAPDYHTVITNPMDFITMRNKIEEDAYENVHQMKADAELIVSNALLYNNPNTVYHLAASRLSAITKYYFSEQYLRYIFHSLPFANKVPLEKAGLTPLMPLSTNVEKKAVIVDKMTASDCKKAADPSTRDKLSARKPAKIAFMDNKDGATALNIIGETEKKTVKLIDVIGPLEEGNPGMLALGDHRLSSVAAVNYLNYGPFCSFAPQYDSTWASLTKKDSDLLLRTYGDRGTVSDVISLRSMVQDSSEHMIKVVDDLLDTLTDGEHSRATKVLEKKKDEISDDTPIDTLLDEIETLDNLGIDVSFVNDLRENYQMQKSQSLQAQLNQNGQALKDLSRLQHTRLSKPPQTTLSKPIGPSAVEIQLASTVQTTLTTQIASHTQPAQMVSATTIHNAIGIENDVDMEIFGEFFVT